MLLLDIVIVIVIVGFVFKGLKLGLIEAIGGIVGIIVGIIAANYYYAGVADWLYGFIKNALVCGVGGYLLTFIVANRLVVLVFHIINKMFNIIAIIPFLKAFNHLLGAVFGLIEGALIIGIILYIITILPFGEKLISPETSSKFAPQLIKLGSMVEPFLPERLKELQNLENIWPSNLVPQNLDLKQFLNAGTINTLGEQGKSLLNNLNQVQKGAN